MLRTPCSMSWLIRCRSVWARVPKLTMEPVFDRSIYSSDSAGKASDILGAADAFRFDGSDIMPGDVGASSASGSFWVEITRWIEGQQELREALAEIDRTFAAVP